MVIKMTKKEIIEYIKGCIKQQEYREHDEHYENIIARKLMTKNDVERAKAHAYGRRVMLECILEEITK